MAKGKGKKVASSGSTLRKAHKGPKRHLFKEYKPMIAAFAKAGILSKYYNYESWQLAMAARGCRKADYNEFSRFVVMSLEDKKAYFANLKK